MTDQASMLPIDPVPEQLITAVASGGVWEIALANPPLNLVTKAFLVQLNAVLDEIQRDPQARCVLMHQGAARVFCAGSDMNEFAAVKANAADEKILFEEFVTRKLSQLRLPTIAALDGHALGGGLELALACDMRVAAPEVRVGLTECRIGGLGGSGAVRMARLIGPSRAAQLLFTGRLITASQAMTWGLINEVALEGSALALARQWAAEIASRGPLSNRYAKELIYAALDQPLAAALGLANDLQEKIFHSDDLTSGARAFFEKSPTVFTGR